MRGAANVHDKRADFSEFAWRGTWRSRPECRGGRGCGETYGTTYVDPFYDTITDLNARGNVEKNSKVSPDEVREQLLRLHSGKFCLPGVWALQNFSLRWARRKKMAALVGVRIVVGAAVRPRCRRSVPCGGRGGRGAAKVNPAFVLATVKAQFPQLDSTLHKNVTQRVSATKPQLKKNDASL